MHIHTIDLDYLGSPGSIASYVIEAPQGLVMIETGPARTTDALVRGLAEIGHEPADVRHVLVTHIHFDHAGASGWMAQHGAQVYVHEFGRKHLIDPAKLNASARRIYKDRMEELWGELIPIPASQVTPVHNGDVVHVAGLRIRALETPGHARHHHAFVIHEGGEKIAFTGDAAGTFIAEAPEFISLPTPPPEFELGAWLASVDRLKRERFDRLYPTHFGPVDDPAGHLDRVRQALRDHATRIRCLMARESDADVIRRLYTEWFLDLAASAGVPEEKIGFYVRNTIAGMNVMGMMRYWNKVLETSPAEDQ